MKNRYSVKLWCGYFCLGLMVLLFNSNTSQASPADTELFDRVLHFDGIDDYAVASDQEELDLGDEPNESLTIEFWVKFTSYTPSDLIIKAGENDFGYRIYGDVEYDPLLGNGKCLGYQFQEQAWGQTCTFGNSLATNVWHHVAVVFDGVAMQHSLYVDGNLRLGPNEYYSPLNNSSAPLEVGKGLAGYLEEVRVSNSVRYSGASFTIPSTSFACDGNTLALWHFDEEKDSTTFQDSCGVNNILTGQNGVHTVTFSTVFLPLAVR